MGESEADEEAAPVAIEPTALVELGCVDDDRAGNSKACPSEPARSASGRLRFAALPSSIIAGGSSGGADACRVGGDQGRARLESPLPFVAFDEPMP